MRIAITFQSLLWWIVIMLNLAVPKANTQTELYIDTVRVDWLHSYTGDNYYSEAISLDIGHDDHVYVGGNTRTTSTSQDLVVLKYASNGSLKWTSLVRGTVSYAHNLVGLAVDNGGNSRLAAYAYANSTDYFLANVSNSGVIHWSVLFDGGWSDELLAMALDSHGNVFVTGSSHSTQTDRDYLTVKYDSLGNRLWSARRSLEGDDRPYALALDPENNVYVAGYTSVSFVGRVLTLVKYDADLPPINRSKCYLG